MDTEPRPRFVRPSALALAAWLAVPLVLAKAVHWGWPWEAISGWRVWVRDLLISSHGDVAFAAGFGLAAFALMRAGRRWPRLERGLGYAALLVGAVAAGWAIVSVHIFDYLRSPLTYTLLYLAGDMRSMRSSIGSFVTPLSMGTLVAVVIAYAATVMWSSRAAAVLRPRWRRWVPAFALLVAGVWAYCGAQAAAGRWSDRPDLLIARSPHWELLSSVAEELAGGATVPGLEETFPPEFLDDFRPGRARMTPVSWSPESRGRAPRRPRNLIKVVLESTGARYLSLYGSPYPTTPRLEAEARHALVYDRFYAHAGFTANALVSMSLSLYPYMTWREYTQEYPEFPGETVADVLSGRGYRTAFLSSSYLDYVCMDCFLRNRGYDEILDWKAIGTGRDITSWGGDEGVLVERTLEWIDRDRERPFYATLWTQQSHHPYEPAPDVEFRDFFAGRALPPDDYDLGRYLNTIAQTDTELGRLFAGLRARGLDRDTLVVITGDHGEGFGDPHETWGHGFRAYDEGVRVPLMLWSPALFPQGRRVDTIGGHVDINPTILDLLDVPSPASWEGRSLFSSDRVPRTYFYAANDDYLLGVREDDFKYIYNATRGREELFDLALDPEERHNVAAQHVEKCRVLRQRLAAWKHHAAARLAEAQRQMKPAVPQQAQLQ